MKTLTIKTETALEKHVKSSLNEKASEYKTGIEGVLEDLMRGGCESGFVSELIYYDDTTKFFKKYKNDINALLKEAISNCGSGPKDVFGNKWDESDPLAEDTSNQNLLAWFGYEETARNLALKAGIDLYFG